MATAGAGTISRQRDKAGDCEYVVPDQGRTRYLWPLRHWRGWLVSLAALILIGLSYFPLVIVLSNSLKSPGELASSGPFAFFTNFHLGNYVTAFNGVGGYLLNTIIVACLAICLGVPCAALAAYAFAQSRFAGKEVLFYFYLGLLLIPWTLTLVPLFVEVRTLGLFGNWGALILPYAATAQPLLLFLDRSFFEGLPNELYQSARIDGASEVQILRKIVVPLSRPILLTGVVLTAITVWGDYLWPSIVIPTTSRLTVSAGLQAFVSSFGPSGLGSGAVFAAYIIITVPLFVLVAGTMKYFVNGITAGASKL